MALREELILNNSFIVSVGILRYSFSKVSNIVDSMETEVYNEGGDNWHVHNLMKPKTSTQTLVLEKGTYAGNKEMLMDSVFTTGMPVYGLTVIVMQHLEMKKAYAITSGMVTKVEMTNLDALGSEPMYKTIEITHNGLHAIPLPL